jgi:Holliday junction DNA helicase RuvA
VIAFVRGNVVTTTITSAVVETGGFGMHVLCTPTTLARLRVGQAAQIFTSMVVREDSMTLYGFADADERDMFELVQTASGVGPKVAQAMVAVLSPDELRTAIVTEDLGALTKVSGVGRKGAQRIVLELKDRVGAPSGGLGGSPAATNVPVGWRDQVHTALLGLGWTTREADDAVGAVAALAAEQTEQAGRPDVSALLRASLRTLSRA